MVACDGNCASLRPSEVALMLLCSYLDTTVNQLMNANADTTVNNLSRNASIPPTYQRLRDELMQFAAELREKCNVSVHPKAFLYYFLNLLFISYVCVRLLIF